MLRPVDMTLTIQATTDTTRAGTQGANAARPEVASQMFADRLEKQTKMQESQVVKSNESEKSDVNPDRQGHGGGYQPNRRNAPKKEEPKKAKPRFAGESLYDIKI
ncbi:MAG: hypothetical protein FWB80_11910 [Defluviitaleaceae bacterium]|nr:hypothetical protein [Defluviitaleaceae bacterium]